MDGTETKYDASAVTYTDASGDSISVVLDQATHVSVGQFVEGDFLSADLDIVAVEHLRDRLTEWLGS